MGSGFRENKALAKDRENPKWTYERGEGRYKHRWINDYPGFEPGSKGPVGKCPAGRAPLPRKIKRQLEEKAEKSGFLKEYTSWMKFYG